MSENSSPCFRCWPGSPASAAQTVGGTVVLALFNASSQARGRSRHRCPALDPQHGWPGVPRQAGLRVGCTKMAAAAALPHPWEKTTCAQFDFLLKCSFSFITEALPTSLTGPSSRSIFKAIRDRLYQTWWELLAASHRGHFCGSALLPKN